MIRPNKLSTHNSQNRIEIIYDVREYSTFIPINRPELSSGSRGRRYYCSLINKYVFYLILTDPSAANKYLRPLEYISFDAVVK